MLVTDFVFIVNVPFIIWFISIRLYEFILLTGYALPILNRLTLRASTSGLVKLASVCEFLGKGVMGGRSGRFAPDANSLSRRVWLLLSALERRLETSLSWKSLPSQSV